MMTKIFLCMSSESSHISLKADVVEYPAQKNARLTLLY